jgi:hypothetical protein
LLKADVAVAVGEIRDMWPPLWEFLKAGFDEVFKLASARFQIAFKEAWDTITTYITYSGPLQHNADVVARKTAEIAAKAKAAADALTADAQKGLEAAFRNFDAGMANVTDSGATKASKEQVEKLKAL